MRRRRCQLAFRAAGRYRPDRSVAKPRAAARRVALSRSDRAWHAPANAAMGDLSSCSYGNLNSFSLQRIAQLARAAMYVRLDGALRLLQHLGNLTVGEAFNVAQHHGDAHMRRKPSQRGRHLTPQLGGFRGDIGPEAAVVSWLEDWPAIGRFQRYHAQRTARYT